MLELSYCSAGRITHAHTCSNAPLTQVMLGRAAAVQSVAENHQPPAAPLLTLNHLLGSRLKP